MAIAVAAAIYVYVAEPHIAYREWRDNETPRVVSVVYVFYACGEDTPRLYEIVSDSDDQLRWSDEPTILALPRGLPSPEETNLAVNGNRFLLTGYGYRAERRNRLTGSVDPVRSTRFDLVSWEAVTPYQIWVEEDDGQVEAQWRDSPVRHAVVSEIRTADRFAPGTRNRC